MKKLLSLMLALTAVICIAGCSTLTEVDPNISTTPQTSFNESSAVSQNEPVSFSESKTESEPTDKSTVESKDTTEKKEPQTTETSRPTTKIVDTTTPPAVTVTTEPPKEEKTEVSEPVKETQTEETAPVAPARPDSTEIQQKVAEKINALRMAQGSPAAVVLPGLTEVAVYRSGQLISDFSHNEAVDVCTLLKYGEFVDMSPYGYPESSYYVGFNREACAKGNWTGTADEIAEKIAVGFQNSSGHWSYVGDAQYIYMAVGITYNPANGYWYCCVCMSAKNYGG